MESKYLKAFEELSKTQAVELIGDLLVVERLPEPEARDLGGIIVQDGDHVRAMFGSESRPHLALVVATGKGYYSDAGSVELNTKPGDIVVIGNASVKYFSSFGLLDNYAPDSLGITRDSDVQIRFRGKDGYKQAFDILNQYGNKKTV